MFRRYYENWHQQISHRYLTEMILAEMEKSSSLWHSKIIDEVFQRSSSHDERLCGRNNEHKSCFSPLHNEEMSLDSAADDMNDFNELSTAVPTSFERLSYLLDVETYLGSSSENRLILSPKDTKQNSNTCDLLRKVSHDLPEAIVVAAEKDSSEQTLVKKKSISQTLVRYQNSRKRKLSFSAVSVSRSRNSSDSWDTMPLKIQVGDQIVSADACQKPLNVIEKSNANLNEGIPRKCYDMEVYGEIPTSCLDHDDMSVIVPSATPRMLQTETVNHGTLTSIMDDSFLIHHNNGYPWSMNASEENQESVMGNYTCNVNNADEYRSYSSNQSDFGACGGTVSDVIETKFDFHQHTKIDAHVKCELPSDGVTFPDEICLESIADLYEYVSSNDSLLNYFSLEDLPKEAEIIRRKPGRPRKKSLTQSVTWYHSHNKRQASMSHSSMAPALSCSGQENTSDTSSDSLQPNQLEVLTIPDEATERKAAHTNSKIEGKSRNVASGRRIYKQSMSLRQSSRNSYPKEVMCNERPYNRTIKYDSEDDTIVDVVTVPGSDPSNPAYARLFLPLIQAFHNYCSPANAQRHHVKNCNTEAKFKLVLEQSPSSLTVPITCPSAFVRQSVPLNQQSSLLTGTASSSSVSTSNRHRVFQIRKRSSCRPSGDQKLKREALNDLERQRRREMTREITALRVVVPAVRDNSRAAKVAILEAAVNLISSLELTLERNKSVLSAELRKMVQLKARLADLSSR